MATLLERIQLIQSELEDRNICDRLEIEMERLLDLTIEQLERLKRAD